MASYARAIERANDQLMTVLRVAREAMQLSKVVVFYCPSGALCWQLEEVRSLVTCLHSAEVFLCSFGAARPAPQRFVSKVPTFPRPAGCNHSSHASRTTAVADAKGLAARALLSDLGPRFPRVGGGAGSRARYPPSVDGSLGGSESARGEVGGQCRESCVRRPPNQGPQLTFSRMGAGGKS